MIEGNRGPQSSVPPEVTCQLAVELGFDLALMLYSCTAGVFQTAGAFPNDINSLAILI